MEDEYYFSPEKGNVAFASAIDCWGFTVESYADLFSAKLGVDKELLRQHLWGDFYYSPAQKKFIKFEGESTKKAAFVMFALEPLWKRYEKVASLKSGQDTTAYKEARSKVKELLSKQMPLDNCILSLIAKHLPSPTTAQKYRLTTLCPSLYTPEAMKSDVLCKIREAIEKVDNSEDAPVVVYVSKMMAIERSQISDLKDEFLSELDSSDAGTVERLALIAFSRVFSGHLQKGKKVYVIGPKHNKEKGIVDIHEVTMNHLYTFMGMHLEVSDSLCAGCVGGLGGLDSYLYKTGTISTIQDCPSFVALNNKSKPIVKVALEASRLSDMEKLSEGLKKLNKADPSVEVYLTDSGEYILCTCGEVHLQKCVKDLKDEYAKVEFKVSEPLVNFRETILLRYMKPEKALAKVHSANQEENGEKLKPKEEEDKKTPEKIDIYLDKLMHLKDLKQNGLAIDITPNGRCKMHIRAIGLDFEVTKWMETKRSLVKKIAAKQVDPDQLEQFVKEFKAVLQSHSTPKKIINLILGYLVSFGPKRNGPNMVISPYLQPTQGLLYVPTEVAPSIGKYHRTLPEELFKYISFEELHKAIISGFELATSIMFSLSPYRQLPTLRRAHGRSLFHY